MEGCKPSSTVMSIEIKSFERGLVVHFADPAMKRLYGFLWSLGIQYIDGKSQSSSLVETKRG